MLDGLHRVGGRQVGITPAGFVDKHYVLGIFDELAAVQCPYERFVYLAPISHRRDRKRLFFMA